MFSQTDMTRLVDAMRRTGTTQLEIDGRGDHLRLVLAPLGAAPAASVAPVAAPAATPVKSPALGRFHPCGADDGLPAVAPGDTVIADQLLGYVTDGDSRLPVTAPVAGVLGAQTPEAGQITGFGDVLFELEAEA